MADQSFICPQPFEVTREKFEFFGWGWNLGGSRARKGGPWSEGYLASGRAGDRNCLELILIVIYIGRVFGYVDFFLRREIKIVISRFC